MLLLAGCTAARGADDRLQENDAATAVGWEQLASGTQESLHAVQFIDENEGFVAGENVTLRRTVDGGRNWAPVGVPTDIEAASGLTALHFADADNGWVAGQTVLLHTQNGGLDWKGWRDWGPTQLPSFNAVFAITDSTAWTAGGVDDSSDPTHCVSPKTSSRLCPTLWRSRLAAPNVLDSAEHRIRGDYDFFTDVSFVGGDVGYAVGTRGLIFRIDNAQAEGAIELSLQDAGIIPYADAPSFNAVFMFDDHTAWVVGQQGLIFQTLDGQTWTAQNSGVKFDLHDVAFVDVRTGWVVGDHGTVLRTQDGGATWARLRLPMEVDETLYALSLPSSNTGYVAGDHGTVMKWSQPSTRR